MDVERLKKLRDGMASGISFPESDHDLEFFDCEICAIGKAQRKAIHGHPMKRAEKVGELVHWDVCGPMDVSTSGGMKWMLLGVDDMSRFTFTHFMQKKGEAEEIIMQTVSHIERKFGTGTVKRIHTDNGGEFTSNWLGEELKKPISDTLPQHLTYYNIMAL